MSESLRVLFWGTAQDGPCAWFRGHLFDDEWRKLGIEARHISNLAFDLDRSETKLAGHPGDCTCAGCVRKTGEALRLGRFDVDTSPLDEADVIIFRRYYNTWTQCIHAGCGWEPTDDPTDRIRHMQETGHLVNQRDEISRLAWRWLRDRDDKALIYETDDNHFTIKPWNGYYPDVIHEQELIREMARRADLVTVSTPRLGSHYGRYNPHLRVIRNAIDPSLYTADTPRPDDGKVRVLYYGSDARMRDYLGQAEVDGKQSGGGAYHAVSRTPNLLTIFIGWNGNDFVRPYFRELVPYVKGFEEFGRAMANTHADIGLAPLVMDDFDVCKSELHWLEYAAIGAVTIAQRSSGPGPYSVIRDGVDGLLARGKGEWEVALGRLAREPALRADLAAAARERVEREYDYRVRAAEWAEAFREAADNRGRGLARLAAA